MRTSRIILALLFAPAGCFSDAPAGTGGDTDSDSDAGTDGTATGAGSTSGASATMSGTTTTSATDSGGTTAGTGTTGAGTCGDTNAPDCGDHGTCMDGGGGPVCECDLGWDGAECDACAPDWMDEGGACVPDCGAPCEAHALCDGAGGAPQCVCVSGYEDLGNGCEWDGGLKDPLFAEGLWTPVVATIDPAGFGVGDGSATFNPTGWCGLSSVSQTAAMPNYADAEPLVFELKGIRTGNPQCEASAGIRMNTQLQKFNMPSGATTQMTFCLGEAAYGGDVNFGVVPDAETNNSCSNPASSVCQPPIFREASIRVAAADECPLPGVVANGDFAAQTDWTLWKSGTNGYPETADISGGTLNLGIQQTCSHVYAQTTLSFPAEATVPNAAIALTQTGTDGRQLPVLLNNRVWTTLTGSGTARTSTLCLPAYARGMVYDLKFDIDAPGGCGGANVTDFTLDNIAFVSDPACSEQPFLDGTFEASIATGSETPWRLVDDGGCGNCDGLATVDTSPANAHGGDGVLRAAFSGAYQFGGVSAHARARVPQGDANNKPALRFWYRKTGPGPSQMTVWPGNQMVTGDGTWTEKEVCLLPDLGGQVMDLVFRWSASGIGQADHWIDDVELVLSPDC